MRYVISGLIVVACSLPAVVFAQDLAAELRALESLRKGDKTPLDVVNRRGAELLDKYEEPADQALIHFDLAHIHAQSALQQPDQVIKHARAALDSKLITPEQRGTLYSYLASAHEVEKDIKDFAERRRNALKPLLEGLAELEAMKLPVKAPEVPGLRLLREDFGDPAEQARARAAYEASRIAREKAQRIERLVFHRKTLKDQVKWLYYRDPVADDELRELASEKVSEELAEELVEMAQEERERIEKARQEQRRKLQQKDQ
jgi:hypothetical protein